MVGSFSLYYKTTNEKQIKIESHTANEATPLNILEALKKGLILYLEDPDDILMRMIKPILDWKKMRMIKVLLHYVYNPDDI